LVPWDFEFPGKKGACSPLFHPIMDVCPIPYYDPVQDRDGEDEEDGASSDDESEEGGADESDGEDEDGEDDF